MDEFRNEDSRKFKENIYTKAVNAGKRTYYFDVKETKEKERYITLTERKRRYNEDGSFRVEKHKIFLYKEDFDKFANALDDIIDFVESGKSKADVEDESTKDSYLSDFAPDINFDDLDKM